MYKNCKYPYYTLTLLYVHHLFASFLYFGWISKRKNILLMHILSVFLVILVQILYKYKCPSTVIVNENCNINRDNYLRDFLYFSNIKLKKIYYVYIFISFIISCIKLYNFQIKK